MFSSRATVIGQLFAAASLLVAAPIFAQSPDEKTCPKTFTPTEELAGQRLCFRGHMVRDGIMVARVEWGGPAWQMGLEPGDIVVKINDQRICCWSHYYRALAEAH
jgi:S1-C subfamily serine protease